MWLACWGEAARRLQGVQHAASPCASVRLTSDFPWCTLPAPLALQLLAALVRLVLGSEMMLAELHERVEAMAAARRGRQAPLQL